MWLPWPIKEPIRFVASRQLKKKKKPYHDFKSAHDSTRLHSKNATTMTLTENSWFQILQPTVPSNTETQITSVNLMWDYKNISHIFWKVVACSLNLFKMTCLSTLKMNVVICPWHRLLCHEWQSWAVPGMSFEVRPQRAPFHPVLMNSAFK